MGWLAFYKILNCTHIVIVKFIGAAKFLGVLKKLFSNCGAFFQILLLGMLR